MRILILLSVVLCTCKSRPHTSDLTLKKGLAQFLDLKSDPKAALKNCLESASVLFLGNAEQPGSLLIPEVTEEFFGEAFIANWQMASNFRSIEYHKKILQEHASLVLKMSQPEQGCVGNNDVVTKLRANPSQGDLSVWSIIDGPNVALSNESHSYVKKDMDGYLLRWNFGYELANEALIWRPKTLTYFSFDRKDFKKSQTIEFQRGDDSFRKTVDSLSLGIFPVGPIEYLVADATKAVIKEMNDRAQSDKNVRNITFVKGHGGALRDELVVHQEIGYLLHRTFNLPQTKMQSAILLDGHGTAAGGQSIPAFYAPLWDPETACTTALQQRSSNSDYQSCIDRIRKDVYELAKFASIKHTLKTSPSFDTLLGKMIGREKNTSFNANIRSRFSATQADIQNLIKLKNQMTPTQGDPISGGQGDPTTGGQGDPVSGGQGDPITGGQSVESLTLGLTSWRRPSQGKANLYPNDRKFDKSLDGIKMPFSTQWLTTSVAARGTQALATSDTTNRRMFPPLGYQIVMSGSRLDAADDRLNDTPHHSLVVYDTCFASMSYFISEKVVPWPLSKTSQAVILANPLPLMEDAVRYGELNAVQLLYATDILRSRDAQHAKPTDRSTLLIDYLQEVHGKDRQDEVDRRNLALHPFHSSCTQGKCNISSLSPASLALHQIDQQIDDYISSLLMLPSHGQPGQSPIKAIFEDFAQSMEDFRGSMTRPLDPEIQQRIKVSMEVIRMLPSGINGKLFWSEFSGGWSDSLLLAMARYMFVVRKAFFERNYDSKVFFVNDDLLIAGLFQYLAEARNFDHLPDRFMFPEPGLSEVYRPKVVRPISVVAAYLEKSGKLPSRISADIKSSETSKNFKNHIDALEKAARHLNNMSLRPENKR